jgi:hypothetical protein
LSRRNLERKSERGDCWYAGLSNFFWFFTAEAPWTMRTVAQLVSRLLLKNLIGVEH